MKDILLLFSVTFLLSSSLTLAGDDRELDEDEANKALDLWAKHCLDQSGGEDLTFRGYDSYGSASVSKAQIHCKFGPDYVDNSKVVVRPTYSTPREPIKQVIFITPPVHNVRHEINLKGVQSPPRKTLIYVFPAKTTHQFQYQDNRVASSQKLKPTVYFLKNSKLEPQNGGYGGPSYETAASSLPVQNIVQQTHEYTPKPVEYASKPVEYVPTPVEYAPKPVEYDRKPVEYVPTPTEYVPTPIEYTPKPTEYDPKPAEYVHKSLGNPSLPSHFARQPVFARQTIIVRQPPVVIRQSDNTPRQYQPVVQYNALPVETVQKLTKSETVKPRFDIFPATFAGYYYSGPNDNGANIPTPLK